EADTRYYLIFRVVGAVTNSTNHTIFKSFSLTPVTGDEAPVESSDYEYVFTAEVFPDNLKDGNGYVQRPNLAAMTFETPNSEKTDPWRAVADRYIDNVAARPATGLSGATTFTGFNIWSRDGDSSSCFAMELKVEDGGTYIPNLSYFATGAATDVAIYLVKAGTELGGVKTSDFKIQTSRGSNDGGLWSFILKITGNEEGVYILKSPENPLNMYGTFVQGGAPVTENFENREIEIEDNTSYYLIIRRIGNVGSKQLSLHSFALRKPEISDKLLSLFLIAGGDSVLMGNTLPLTAMAKYMLAGKKPLTNGITYESLNKDIAEVSADGVIKGIKPGEATIKATVDGTDISATFTVTVKIPSGLGMKLFYADVK
ncbi:MAG: Ig-like domain-containing protein, partial [Oscillospiraceae bacterium]|nr:Ig-like domain-containing protein [Oscillospiraceae bacterium]